MVFIGPELVGVPEYGPRISRAYLPGLYGAHTRIIGSSPDNRVLTPHLGLVIPGNHIHGLVVQGFHRFSLFLIGFIGFSVFLNLSFFIVFHIVVLSLVSRCFFSVFHRFPSVCHGFS